MKGWLDFAHHPTEGFIWGKGKLQSEQSTRHPFPIMMMERIIFLQINIILIGNNRINCHGDGWMLPITDKHDCFGLQKLTVYVIQAKTPMCFCLGWKVYRVNGY
ncbi:hypothetical protein [Calothrix sp. 336/3]|uniref:hypothetical protein n=1 Tax=Calothrix sp. 336/3 TaxID=1337936 RepID=UPI0004E35EC5|nr:hypothetical protein [Calothrix sp. 336/3]AKG22615.1 hypothetical protein IJ00_16255 [Calothrix sp. 336/3]